MTGRSSDKFGSYINGLGFLTGANTLDVAKIAIYKALLTSSVSLLTDAFQQVHSELQIKNEDDGIRADGSFGLWILDLIYLFVTDFVGQHDGILYNGNYGMYSYL